MVLSPGFEPGYSARKAEMMGRTTPRELKILLRKLEFNIMGDFKLQMPEVGHSIPQFDVGNLFSVFLIQLGNEFEMPLVRHNFQF